MVPSCFAILGEKSSRGGLPSAVIPPEFEEKKFRDERGTAKKLFCREPMNPCVKQRFMSGRDLRQACDGTDYSHSMVAGGLLEISKQTRLTPFTSLMIRV